MMEFGCAMLLPDPEMEVMLAERNKNYWKLTMERRLKKSKMKINKMKVGGEERRRKEEICSVLEFTIMIWMIF